MGKFVRTWRFKEGSFLEMALDWALADLTSDPDQPGALGQVPLPFEYLCKCRGFAVLFLKLLSSLTSLNY